MHALLTGMSLGRRGRRASCRKLRQETGMAPARRGFAAGFQT